MCEVKETNTVTRVADRHHVLLCLTIGEITARRVGGVLSMTRGVLLVMCMLAFARLGIAEDKVGVAAWECPPTLRIKLDIPPGGNLDLSGGKLHLEVPLLGRDPRKTRQTTAFPALVSYCPRDGDCVEGTGKVYFKKVGKKDGAGTYSLRLANGATDQSSFRVILPGEPHLFCE